MFRYTFLNKAVVEPTQIVAPHPSIVINSLAMERAGSAEAKERTSSAEANCDSSNDTRFIDSRKSALVDIFGNFKVLLTTGTKI